MSWDTYISTMVALEGVDEAAIFGRDCTVWASSPGFPKLNDYHLPDTENEAGDLIDVDKDAELKKQVASEWKKVVADFESCDTSEALASALVVVAEQVPVAVALHQDARKVLVARAQAKRLRNMALWTSAVADKYAAAMIEFRRLNNQYDMEALKETEAAVAAFRSSHAPAVKKEAKKASLSELKALRNAVDEKGPLPQALYVCGKRFMIVQRNMNSTRTSGIPSKLLGINVKGRTHSSRVHNWQSVYVATTKLGIFVALFNDRSAAHNPSMQSIEQLAKHVCSCGM